MTTICIRNVLLLNNFSDGEILEKINSSEFMTFNQKFIQMHNWIVNLNEILAMA